MTELKELKELLEAARAKVRGARDPSDAAICALTTEVARWMTRCHLQEEELAELKSKLADADAELERLSEGS